MPYAGASPQREIGAGPPIAPTSPTSLFGNPATFTAAANTQASDYDKIMSQYDDLIKTSAQSPITAGVVGGSNVQAPSPISPSSNVNFQQVNPQLSKYEQSGATNWSLANLGDLAATGGYSDADKQNIRERAISPTRSIYANAQQNAERQKALAGGYSPNFNATQAKMAREESDQISGINTNANAAIAQNVATNRISAGGAYSNAAQSANAAQTESDRHNADIINQINQYNSQGGLQASEFNSSNANDFNKFNTSIANSTAENNANRATSTNQFNVNAALQAALANRGTTQSAIQGKTNLYGTTPALTNTFGNQVVQAGQLGQNQQQLNDQKLNTFRGWSG